MAIWHRKINADIEARVSNPAVLELLGRWQAAPRGSAALPEVAMLSPALLPHLQDRLMLLQAEGETFRYHHYGRAIAGHAGFDMTGRTVTDFGGELADFFVSCYRQTLAERTPLYAVHYSDRAATVFTWERLILPMADAAQCPWLLVHNAPFEERHTLLSSVFNATSDSVLALRAIRSDSGALQDWLVVMLNDALAHLAGRALANPVGRPVSEALLRWSDLGLQSICEAVVDSGQRQVFDLQILVRGEPLDYSGEATPLEDGCVLRLVDVTQPRRREHELQRINQQLQQARAASDAANQAKSAFLATMSHEMRTPMNGVLGTAELLQSSPLDTEQAAMVRTISESALGLLAVIDDVLEFSRLDTQAEDPDKLALWPAALLTALHSEHLAAAAAQQVRLELHLDASAQAAVLGDAARLRNVLRRLLDNAIKFSAGRHLPVDGATGQVRLALWRDEGELCFEITDNGIGIDATTRTRLFQPFVQADSASTRRFGGSGLGLAICDRLVHAMGGRIDMHSQAGQGTRVELRLPWPLAADPPVAADPLAAAPAPSASWRTQRAAEALPWAGHILVAEDDFVSQKIIASQLRLLGYSCRIAGHGEQALALWRGGGFDMLLTDLHMPRLDGYGLTRAIRHAEAAAGHARAPIIMVSANAQAGEGARALGHGVDAYLLKPTDLAVLRDTLAASAGAQRVATPAFVGSAGSSALFDPGCLPALIGDDAAAVADMLRDYLASARVQVEALGHQLRTGDAAEAGSLAHKLKSASRAIGAQALGDFCADLESRQGPASPAARRWRVKAFDRLCEATFDLIQAQLDGPAP